MTPSHAFAIYLKMSLLCYVAMLLNILYATYLFIFLRAMLYI
jgi:hypothetical protein